MVFVSIALISLVYTLIGIIGSYHFKLLYEIGDSLYVTIGGAGSGTTGGYNGGGTGGDYAGGAGGASHMAYVSGTLASIGKATFDANGLLVAGGAGGGSGNWAVGGWCSSGGGAGGGGRG